MASAWKIIIWERSNKTGKWCVYPGDVCQLLEQSYQKNLNSVLLGDADAAMKNYTVNLKNMVQVSEISGTECIVRRRVCDESSIVADQILWQWQGDGHDNWHCYSFDVMTFIENAYKSGNDTVDLSDSFSEYAYKINFKTMVQKNKKSKFHRLIRRINAANYPKLKLVDEMDTSPPVNNHKKKLYPDLPELDNLDKSPAKKTGIVKQVSNLWSKLTKQSDSDSENVMDHSSDGKSKRKKKIHEASTSHDLPSSNDPMDCEDTRTEYALVNGKAWHHPWPPHTSPSLIKPVPGIDSFLDKRKKRGPRRGRKKGRAMEATNAVGGAIDVFDEFTEEVSIPESPNDSEERLCIICYESLLTNSSYDDDGTLIKLCLCSHVFHKSCVKAMYEHSAKDNHIRCPTCKTIHGVKRGIQPEGSMDYHVMPYSLPGHHDCHTIHITYYISGGIQGPEHPNPGRRYSARGFPRHCYLPDNEIGRKILRLLVLAWERRLIFTIGSSITTGEQDTVTWNEIHHKTEFGFNRHGHGYPDPNYFENIIAELAAQGIEETAHEWFPA